MTLSASAQITMFEMMLIKTGVKTAVKGFMSLIDNQDQIQAEEIIRKAENAATVTLTNAQATKESTINKATAENHTKVAGATSSVSEFMASVEANNTNKDSYQYYKYLNALSQAYGKSNLILVGDGVDTSKIYFGNISNGAILGGADGNTQNSTDIESVS